MKNRRVIRTIAITFTCVIVVFCAFFGSLYAGLASSSLINTVGRLLPLPVALINGNSINSFQWNAELTNAQHVDSSASLSSNELVAKTWQKIQEEYALQALALDYKLTPSRSVLINYANNLLGVDDISKSSEQFKSSAYNLDEFIEHIIRPLYLRKTLNLALLDSGKNTAYTTMQTIASELKANPDAFDVIAKKYNAGPYTSNAEAQLIITEDQLSLYHLDSLENLNVGGITPIIINDEGYSMYRVLNVYITPQKAWQVAEIFLPAQPIDTAIQEYKNKMRIRILLPALINAHN